MPDIQEICWYYGHLSQTLVKTPLKYPVGTSLDLSELSHLAHLLGGIWDEKLFCQLIKSQLINFVKMHKVLDDIQYSIDISERYRYTGAINMYSGVKISIERGEYGPIVTGTITACWYGTFIESGERILSHPGSNQYVLSAINMELGHFLDVFPEDRMIEWDMNLVQTEDYIQYRLTTRACLAILRRNTIKNK